MSIDVAMGLDMQTLERLRSKLLRYAISNPNSWKPTVSFALRDSPKTDVITLDIHVESVFDWQDTRAFSRAEYEIRNLIRAKLSKWGATPPKPFKKLPKEGQS